MRPRWFFGGHLLISTDCQNKGNVVFIGNSRMSNDAEPNHKCTELKVHFDPNAADQITIRARFSSHAVEKVRKQNDTVSGSKQCMHMTQMFHSLSLCAEREFRSRAPMRAKLLVIASLGCPCIIKFIGMGAIGYRSEFVIPKIIAISCRKKTLIGLYLLEFDVEACLIV